MNRFTHIVSALLLIATTSRSADLKTGEEVVAFKYIEVTAAYQALKTSFPEISDLVRTIQIDQNSLTLNLAHAKSEEVRKKIAELDQRPKQIHISAEVAEITDGTAGASFEKVISRPSIYCHDGKPAEIVFSTHDGKKLKLTITATSLSGVAEKSAR